MRGTGASYSARVALLIVILTIFRISLASSIELSNAEVYYWFFSTDLQWTYVDHPPLVALLIKLTTFQDWFHSELAVRIGAILGSAICTVLMYLIGTRLYNQRAGYFAALLYNASIYGSIIVGTFILPDSPQMIFWLSALLMLLRISDSPLKNAAWILFGIFAGLAIMCKIHAAFLWFGLILWTITTIPFAFRKPAIYLSMLITLIIISPFLIWNYHHDFATMNFYYQRVRPSLSSLGFFRFAISQLQVILIANPVNIVLISIALYSGLKGRNVVRPAQTRLLLYVAFPLILSVAFISIFRETLAHWPQPAIITLLFLPAVMMAASSRDKKFKWTTTLSVAFFIMAVVGIGQVLITRLYPGSTSSQQDGLDFGKEDLSLDMYGWTEMAVAFDSLYKADQVSKIMIKAPLLVTKWYPAAHLQFYVVSRTGQQIFPLGKFSDLHEYLIPHPHLTALRDGDNAYYIIPSNQFDFKTLDGLIGSFRNYDLPLVITQFRGGKVCKKIYVFRFLGYRHTL